MNWLLALSGWCWVIEVLLVKYLNNIIEQDQRFVKGFTKPTKGFKSFEAAQATLAGIETVHMIRTGQTPNKRKHAFKQFAELAA